MNRIFFASIILWITLFTTNSVYALELYSKHIEMGDDQVNNGSAINMEDATFSGTIKYVAVKGKQYINPPGNPDILMQWYVQNSSLNLVDCHTDLLYPHEFGFNTFSDISDFDNKDGMNIVILELSGSECDQSYTNASQVILTSTSSATLRISMEETAGYVSPISISSTLDDMSLYQFGTGFYYLDPSNGEVVLTSSENDLYVSLYLSEDEYEPDMFIRLKYVRQQDLQSAVANTDLLWTVLDLDDPVISGYFSYSTTTGDLGLDGVYYFTAELHRDPAWYDTALTWVGLDMFATDYVVSTTTTFVYGSMTSFDQLIASTTQNISDYMASSTLSFEQAKNSCWSLSGFDFTDCMNFIFGWQQVPMSNAINNIKDNFFTYAPFGYVTRTYNILATTSTSSLPTISYTFPHDFPVLASYNFHFDPWQYFYRDGAPVKDELVSSDGKNIWEIFENITKIIVYMTLFWLIIRELLDIRYSNHPKDNL